MKNPKNLGFEPVHPKNVLLASVVHGISCLFSFTFFSDFYKILKLIPEEFLEKSQITKNGGMKYQNPNGRWTVVSDSRAGSWDPNAAPKKREYW
jgi:hypothetical protein